jgi:hypothetical protein
LVEEAKTMAQMLARASKNNLCCGGLFAAWLDGGGRPQILGEIGGIEGFDIHLNERNERAAEVRELAGTAVHDRPGGDDDAAVVADDLDGFLNAAATGDDILGDDETLAGGDLKTSAQDESTVAVFFHEDVFFAQMAGDLLADDDSADGRGDDGGGFEGFELFGEHAADLGGDGGILQQQGALEKLTTVKTAAKDEVPVEKRAGFAEEIEDFVHEMELTFCFYSPTR